jgi:hypothetical protein
MRFPVLLGAQLGLTVIILAVVLLWLPGTEAAFTQATPPLHWDPDLDTLHVTFHPAVNCNGGCWRLTSAEYEDDSESGGNINIYARMLASDGSSLVDAPWHTGWPGGNLVTTRTKPEPEWSGFPMYGGYYRPFEGEAGPFYSYAGDAEGRSDVVRGMGLPYNHHVNFRLVWQWSEADRPAPSPTPFVLTTATLPPRVGANVLGFPMVLSQQSGSQPIPSATPTVPPTSTATPRPGNTLFSGSVVQTFANCGLTQLIGVVHDAAGNPLPDTRIRLTWMGQVGPPLFARAGDYVRQETDASGWDFVLAQTPVSNVWRVAVVDAGGNLLSEEVSVRTDNQCAPGATNVAKVRFVGAP